MREAAVRSETLVKSLSQKSKDLEVIVTELEEKVVLGEAASTDLAKKKRQLEVDLNEVSSTLDTTQGKLSRAEIDLRTKEVQVGEN